MDIEPPEVFFDAALADAPDDDLTATRDNLLRIGRHDPAEIYRAFEAKRPRGRPRSMAPLVSRKITQPPEVWARWEAAAASRHVSVSVYLRLELIEPESAEVEEPVHAVAQAGSLWSRIHAIVGNVPIARAQHGSGPTVWTVKALARKLEVPEKSVYAALHSRMASKRMVRIGDEYLSKGE